MIFGGAEAAAPEQDTGIAADEPADGQDTGIVANAPADGQMSGVTARQSVGLLITMTAAPCALMLLSYILYKKKYRLDEEEYDRICGELRQEK